MSDAVRTGRADPAALERTAVVHRGRRWLALDKPAGVLSVPGKGDDNRWCVPLWVRARFPQATGPITVHRLDMDTSGLLVVALDAEAQRDLSGQFERREVDKRYVAVVEGHVAAERGTLDAPMRLDPDRRPYQVVDPVHGRPAVTDFRVLAYECDRTRLELTPRTGRTHQLRVHCAHAGPGGLGRPIVGDVLYGDATGAERLLLHARWLCLTDPDTGRRVELEAPCPF